MVHDMHQLPDGADSLTQWVRKYSEENQDHAHSTQMEGVMMVTDALAATTTGVVPLNHLMATSWPDQPP